MKKFYLHYNPENDRYGIFDGSNWVNEGLHCGEGLKIRINGVWVPTRMEMNNAREWYLAGTAFRDLMLEKIPAKQN